MASPTGYVVLRKAVPKALVSKLAAEFNHGLPEYEPTAKRDKYNEYKVPPSGFEIKDEFLRVPYLPSILTSSCLHYQGKHDESMTPLFYPNQIMSSPQTLNLGKFHESDADPTKLMTAGPRVYVTIAITTLSPSNGWFTFYEGSHLERSKLGDKVALELEPGDAVAWRGDLVYFHSRGGGGVFLVLSFPMSSDHNK